MLEETGYNLAGQLDPANVIEMSIKEQWISLFVVPGVPEDFPFKTRTRKEISVRSFGCPPLSCRNFFLAADRVVQVNRSSNLEAEQSRPGKVLFNLSLHRVSLFL